jgi:hypothetical protein
MHGPQRLVYKGARYAHLQISRLAGYDGRATRYSSCNDRHDARRIFVHGLLTSMVRITSVPIVPHSDHVDAGVHDQGTFQ